MMDVVHVGSENLQPVTMSRGGTCCICFASIGTRRFHRFVNEEAALQQHLCTKSRADTCDNNENAGMHLARGASGDGIGSIRVKNTVNSSTSTPPGTMDGSGYSRIRS
jgi:hypothetical protein